MKEVTIQISKQKTPDIKKVVKNGKVEGFPTSGFRLPTPDNNNYSIKNITKKINPPISINQLIIQINQINPKN